MLGSCYCQDVFYLSAITERLYYSVNYGLCLCVFSLCISDVTYGFVGLLILLLCVAVLTVFVGVEAACLTISLCGCSWYVFLCSCVDE